MYLLDPMLMLIQVYPEKKNSSVFVSPNLKIKNLCVKKNPYKKNEHINK